MNSYKNKIIIHPIDKSTLFLNEFKNHFHDYYYSFDNTQENINDIKSRLGDLEAKSLVVYIGHGSSNGLYVPDNDEIYEKYFLDINWGNLYFEDHDIILLSCKSSEYIQKLHKYSNAIGFGNILSSEKEVKLHNENAKVKKNLNDEEINIFNSYYVDSLIKSLKLLFDDKIKFHDVPKQIEYFINKKICGVLKTKKNSNRVELAKLLFEFRNEIVFK